MRVLVHAQASSPFGLARTLPWLRPSGAGGTGVPGRDAVAWRRRTAAGAALLLAAVMPFRADAGQASATFDVNIRLNSAAQSTCGTTNTSGGSLAIVCESTRPTGTSKVAANDVSSPGYRVLTRQDEGLPRPDAHGGAITTTAVRVLNVAGRQFIEMTVGW